MLYLVSDRQMKISEVKGKLLVMISKPISSLPGRKRKSVSGDNQYENSSYEFP